MVGARPELRGFLEVLNRTWAPTVAVLAHESSQQPVPPLLRETLEAREPVGGKGAAYYCHHFTCERPLTDPAELKKRLGPIRSA